LSFEMRGNSVMTQSPVFKLSPAHSPPLFVVWISWPFRVLPPNSESQQSCLCCLESPRVGYFHVTDFSIRNPRFIVDWIHRNSWGGVSLKLEISQWKVRCELRSKRHDRLIDTSESIHSILCRKKAFERLVLFWGIGREILWITWISTSPFKSRPILSNYPVKFRIDRLSWSQIARKSISKCIEKSVRGRSHRNVTSTGS
jgi:hypothetical protein